MSDKWTWQESDTVWLELHYQGGAAVWVKLDGIESISEMRDASIIPAVVIGSRIKLATETHEVKETPEQIMTVIKKVGTK